MAKKENAKNKMEQGEWFRAWRAYRDRGEAVEEAAGELKEFLSRCKTEREVVLWLEKKYFRIAKNVDPASLTLQQCYEIAEVKKK